MPKEMQSWVLILTLTLIVPTSCSDICRQLYPIDLRLCDLEGQWNWVLATEDKQRKDCHGFNGQMIGYNKGQFTPTGRTGHAPTMHAEIKDRQLHFNSIDKNCPDTYTYKAALVEDNFICFYECGYKQRHDKAQCFTRDPCISEKDRGRIYRGLRFFGLRLEEEDLKIVDRSNC